MLLLTDRSLQRTPIPAEQIQKQSGSLVPKESTGYKSTARLVAKLISNLDKYNISKKGHNPPAGIKTAFFYIKV